MITGFLFGKSITIDGLQQVLRIDKQRQRTTAAIERAMRQPGQPLFNRSATAFRQQALLGLKS